VTQVGGKRKRRELVEVGGRGNGSGLECPLTIGRFKCYNASGRVGERAYVLLLPCVGFSSFLVRQHEGAFCFIVDIDSFVDCQVDFAILNELS